MKQISLAGRLAPARSLQALAAILSLALAACVTQPPASSASSFGTAAAATTKAAAAVSSSGFSADLADLRDREEAFDQAWHLVNDRFYDPTFNGIDWEAARLRYLPQLERVKSDAGFYSLLGRMVGELRDSHTRIYTSREYRNRMESVMSTTGIRVAEVDGEVAVVEVMPDTPAAQAGMRPGMVVESINGEPARDRLHKLIADAPKDVSPERRLRSIYGRMLSSAGNGPLALEVRAGEAKRRFELARTEREMPLVVTHQVLESNVGLIRFNRFRSDVAADFARALSRLADTDGLVIDLRGNPGGNIGAMLSIAQSFFPETRHVLTRRTRPAGEEDAWRARNSPEVRISANGRAYTRPIAILIDGYSASASELLATVLREQRGAHIVGRPSCGCVVGVRGSGYRLAGGGALYVAETGFVTPQGNRMEGAGIRPDREIAFTLSDLGAGIDRDLVIAREWIVRQSHRQAEEH
jgi:carboxyl-terminal processing protease